MQPVGRTIRALRLKQGMTQQQLAGRLFVTRQTISNWETGASQPGLDQLEAIAKALNTSPEALVKEGPPPHCRPSGGHMPAAALLAVPALALPLCQWFVAPRLAGYAAVTYDLFYMNLYAFLLRPLLQAAAGAFFPALLALRTPLPPGAGWRRAARFLAGAVLLVWAYTALPAALPWLSGSTFPLAYPLSLYLFLYRAVSPLFFLAGAALYLGFAAHAS